MKIDRIEKKTSPGITNENGRAARSLSVFSDETYFRKISCSTNYPGHVCACGSPTYSEYYKSTGPDGAESFKRVERCRRFQASGAYRCKPQTFSATKAECDQRGFRSGLECPNRKTSRGTGMTPKVHGLAFENNGQLC